MSSDAKLQETEIPASNFTQSHVNRIKVAAVILTTLGVGLFVYLVVAADYRKILDGIAGFGVDGFAILAGIYMLRLLARASAWKLSVYEPYKLRLRDTFPAVIIGEALSTMIPLGILVSGTAKAVAVRKKVPLVVGLSSVATENLFYSLVTGIYIVLGGFAFLRSFELTDAWVTTIDLVILAISTLIVLGFAMVIRQWHLASELCESLYKRGFLKRFLEHGRVQVRLFENLIYGFYRQSPQRFAPIILLEATFHMLGIVEVWFVLSRLTSGRPELFTAFLLESISRAIVTAFKLIPFTIGVDEAGAQFVTETLAIGASVGVTLAIVRKGRSLFWTSIGVTLLAKRGLSIREITSTTGEPDDESVSE